MKFKITLNYVKNGEEKTHTSHWISSPTVTDAIQKTLEKHFGKKHLALNDDHILFKVWKGEKEPTQIAELKEIKILNEQKINISFLGGLIK